MNILTIAGTVLRGGMGLFGGVWGYAAVGAVAAAVAGYAADDVRAHFDLTKYQALQLKDAAAVTASLEAQAAALSVVAVQQHRLDTAAALGAVSEAKAQAALVAHTTTITKEIPIYVHDAPRDAGMPGAMPVPNSCVSYGLVRVLDAAAISTGLRPVSPGDLTLPAGQSDDACAPVAASDLATSVAGNYGTAQQNAEQLNALEAWIHNLIDTANK